MKCNILIFSFITLVGFSSCSEDGDRDTEPVTKADIIGSVNLYDEGTTQIDKSGMTVKVDGTSPVISATTNADGRFALSDVPFGTITIIFEKSGFGTFKKFGVEHTNSGAPTIITGAPSLGEASSTQVTNLQAAINGSNVTLSITTNPAGNNQNTRYVRYFLSTDPDVSSENHTFYSPGLVSRINPFEAGLSQNDLINAGFSSGQTVYVKAYGDSFWSNEFDDPDLGLRIFPNLNMTSAAAVSFVVP